MKYKVLKPMIYGGKSYEIGAEVEIFEKAVIKSCIERELIVEIKEIEAVKIEVTGEIENKEDTIEEIVSSENLEESTENTEEHRKNNKSGKNKNR